MSYERGWKRAELALEAALAGGGGGTGAGEATPSQQSQSVIGVFALTSERGMHMNVTCGSDNSGVDFEVPANAAPGMAWLIEPLHTGCYVSIVGDAGSIEPAAAPADNNAYLIAGGVAIAEVISQSVSLDAPVVRVRGSVFTPPK